MLNSVVSQNSSAGETKRILVIDSSEPEAVGRLAWDLPRDRFQITVAAGPDQAMQMVAAGMDYDMALVEVDLPRRASSFSMVRALRARMPSTPVIMYTDYGDEELWVDALSEGAVDLLDRCDLRRGLEARL